jgi:hypothetical protein
MENIFNSPKENIDFFNYEKIYPLQNCVTCAKK